jgi:hypothetical protein
MERGEGEIAQFNVVINCIVTIYETYLTPTSLALAPQKVSQQEHILPFWSTWRKSIRTKLPHEHVKLGAKASMLTHTDM